MIKFNTRNDSAYNTFGRYLNRKGIKNSFSMAYLLIDKFILNDDKDYQRITFEELKEREIITKHDYKTFIHWREIMIKLKVLICMANKDELNQEIPNHKGNYFKVGLLILNHIEKIRVKLLPQKFGHVYNKIGGVEHKVYEIREEVDKNKYDIVKMQEQLDGMLELFFEVMPPKTDVRRKIIQENVKDKEKCLRLLREIDN